MRGRAAAIVGGQYYQQTNDEQAAKGVALAAIGPRGVEDFNYDSR